MPRKNSKSQVASWLCCTLDPTLFCSLCGLKVCKNHRTPSGFAEVYAGTGPCPKALELQGHEWTWHNSLNISELDIKSRNK